MTTVNVAMWASHYSRYLGYLQVNKGVTADDG